MKTIIPGESKNVSPSIRIENSLCSDKHTIASALNKHITSAVARLIQSLGYLGNSISRSIPSNSNSNVHLLNLWMCLNVILLQLRKLENGKTAGLDCIPPRLLKDASAIISKPPADIINASLHQGDIPDDWKYTCVIPLFKKGKAEDMDNYRPISILPTVSKLLERVVHTQLCDYLSKYNILSPYQCGFRKLHSTEFAAPFANTIRRHIDQGFLTGAVFIDFRKAFDSIDYSVLLNKLSALRTLDKEYKWFENYLSDTVVN